MEHVQGQRSDKGCALFWGRARAFLLWGDNDSASLRSSRLARRKLGAVLPGLAQQGHSGASTPSPRGAAGSLPRPAPADDSQCRRTASST